jgi:hypothetical protein
MSPMNRSELMLLFKMRIAMFSDHKGIALEKDLLERAEIVYVNFDANPDLFGRPVPINQGIHPGPLSLKDQLAAFR